VKKSVNWQGLHYQQIITFLTQ